MKKNISILLVLFCIFTFAFMLLSCNSKDQTNNNNDNEENSNGENNSNSDNKDSSDIDDDEVLSLVESNNEFAFDIFSPMVTDGENIFISPLSMSFALAMTYNGAVGETQQEMAEALNLNNMDIAVVNNSFKGLIEYLENPDEGVKLSIANSLWGKDSVEFNQDFFDTLQKYYEAQANTLDFSDPDSPNTINDWVKNNTNGMIKKLIDNIAPETILYLINAIYFYGEWTVSFDEEKTYDYEFKLEDGSTTPVRMMRDEGLYHYMEEEKFNGLRLSYGKNSKVGMYILLPNDGYKVQDIVDQLNLANWNNWMEAFTENNLDAISIPKFKIEYDTSLVDYLKQLGMKLAFTENADLSNIANIENLLITDVVHKAVVEVDEKGTEAAAVTGVIVGTTSIQEKLVFIADHPFLFVIRDDVTGSILFMGILSTTQQ